MLQFRIFSLFTVLAVPLVCRGDVDQEPAGPAPDFKEVYELIRSHLTGVSEAELNRAAVQGLVSALGPKVLIDFNGATTPARGESALLSKEYVFDGPIAYLRISRVAEGLGEALSQACRTLGATNRLKGVVLDLRYTAGDDYAAVPEVVELFLEKDQPLLDWGQGLVRAKPKAGTIQVPSAVLVNGKTAGAAEALAAVLRQTGAGLILGSRTAGYAMTSEAFPLANGGRLRIATGPIHLADGSDLSSQGVLPDIKVEVGSEEERAYFADAFRVRRNTNSAVPVGLASTNDPAGTNRAARRTRYNEAELVRERREGPASEGAAAPARDREADRPLVLDPALARALDLLKGLAVVRQGRS
jgi:hypothetical protein